ncbi:MAG: hypothetical protein II368_06280 [Clostridia bacterium]|nr:hypothetical protein [Clostridia bacterium]
MKKWKKAGVILLAVAAFSAYVGNDFTLVNVGQTAAVTAIAIDVAENGYEISAQIAMPKGDATSPKNEPKVISERAQTVSGALALLGKTTGWYLKTSFCSAVVLGEEVVKGDVTPLLESFIKDPRLQDAAQLVACKGSAKELLLSSAPTDDVSAFALGKVLQFGRRSPGGANAVTVKDFMLSLREKGQSAHMPFLVPVLAEEGRGFSLTEGISGVLFRPEKSQKEGNGSAKTEQKGEKPNQNGDGEKSEQLDQKGEREGGQPDQSGGENPTQADLNGGGTDPSQPDQSGGTDPSQPDQSGKEVTYDASSTLLFYKGKARALLDAKQSLPYALLSTKKSALLPVSVEEGALPDCLLAVTQNGSKMQLKKEGDSYVFSVRLRLTAKVEDGVGISALRPASRKGYLPSEVKQAAERDLASWARQAFALSKETNCDFFGITERIFRRYPRAYAKGKENPLKNVTFRVTVTVSPLR